MLNRGLIGKAYYALRRAALPFYPPPDDAPRVPQTAAEFHALLMDPERIPLRHWQYKGTKEWHVGPSAQQWFKATGLGRNDRTIFATDIAFALLAALRHAEKDRQKLQKRISSLEKRLDALEAKKPGGKT